MSSRVRRLLDVKYYFTLSRRENESMHVPLSAWKNPSVQAVQSVTRRSIDYESTTALVLIFIKVPIAKRIEDRLYALNRPTSSTPTR